MTQEEKDLLFEDLSGRLVYGVKGLHREQVHYLMDINWGWGRGAIQVDNYDAWFPVDSFKPYLRPMSSMTGAEVLEYISLKESIVASDGITYSFETYKSIDYLNAHYIDFRGLIPMGIALEASNDMYKIHEQK